MAKMAWGVIGTAKIAVEKVVPGMTKSGLAEVVAIASRDRAKAEKVAAALGLAKAHGSYEALLADPAIEAIYNPLPNHLHVPWTIRAMEAGKHVLCEKPIALDAAEAESLIAARERTEKQVLEAFMVRQHPRWLRTRDLVRAGRIGEVGVVQTALCYYNVDPGNIRNRADIGGGSLYDIGCYAVATARFLFEAEPLRAVSLIDRDPLMQTDRLTSGIVEFPDGKRLVFTSSTQLARYQTVQVLGTKGRIEVQIPMNAPPDRPTRIFIDDASTLDGSGIVAEEFPTCDQYALQADEAVRVFRGEIPAPFPIEDAVANMAVIDALYRSGASREWEGVAARG
jgi:predicted dehydrogenase